MPAHIWLLRPIKVQPSASLIIAHETLGTGELDHNKLILFFSGSKHDTFVCSHLNLILTWRFSDKSWGVSVCELLLYNRWCLGHIYLLSSGYSLDLFWNQLFWDWQQRITRLNDSHSDCVATNWCLFAATEPCEGIREDVAVLLCCSIWYLIVLYLPIQPCIEVLLTVKLSVDNLTLLVAHSDSVRLIKDKLHLVLFFTAFDQILIVTKQVRRIVKQVNLCSRELSTA